MAAGGCCSRRLQSLSPSLVAGEAREAREEEERRGREGEEHKESRANRSGSKAPAKSFLRPSCCLQSAARDQADEALRSGSLKRMPIFSQSPLSLASASEARERESCVC